MKKTNRNCKPEFANRKFYWKKLKPQPDERF